MSKLKMKIEINNHSYEKEMIYAAIGFRGGFAVNRFILNQEKEFKNNYSFFNVLFNYLRLQEKTIGIRFNVFRASSTVSFSSKKEDFIGCLNNMIDTLFDFEYDTEIFSQAKVETKEKFAKHYKEGAFRATYKAYEFADLHKGFKLKNLITDIENIDFDNFKETAKTLIVPSNVFIYISGDVSHDVFNDLVSLDKYDFNNVEDVLVSGYEFDPFLRQDSRIINVAREDTNCMVIAYDFINKEVTNFTKLLIVEMFAESLPLSNINVHIDSFDASMIALVKNLRSYKEDLSSMSEKRFEKSKSDLLLKYIELMKNNPEYFVIKATNMILIGVSIEQYLSYIDKMDYKMFQDICAISDHKISEAQILLSKEVI